MNYIAIGDIHGRNDLLQSLLGRARVDYPSHKLLFLGDYIDRGPDSYSVVETIKNLCEKGDAIAVKGNHESMMMDFSRSLDMRSDDIWLYNGGHKTMKSYMKHEKDFSRLGYIKAFQDHRRFLENLPLFYETEELWASHAPISVIDGKANHYRDNLNACTWTYYPMENMKNEGVAAFNHGKLAVCGHIHRLQQNYLEPRIFPHVIYADTGCGCADFGPLTGIVIENGKYVSHFQAANENVSAPA